MPGLGRGPPGRWGTLPGPPGWRGMTGRGAGVPPPTPNGLLPTRGPGRGPAGAAGRDGADWSAGAADAAGATGAAGAVAGAATGAAGPAGGAAGALGAGGAGTITAWGSGTGGDWVDCAGGATGWSAGCSAAGAAAFLAGARFFGAAGWASGNASRSLRATGASTVDEAVLTYSPIAVSFSIASLLLIPISLARADTRVLPGTCLLRKGPCGQPADPVRGWTYSLLALHRVPIARHLLRGSAGGPITVMLREVLDDRSRVQRAGHLQCPGEGPTPLREFSASRVAVQPSTSAREAPARVRHDLPAPGIAGTVGRIRRHDDAEQFGGHRSLPAPDARSKWALWVHSCPNRPVSDAVDTPTATRKPTPRGPVQPIRSLRPAVLWQGQRRAHRP